VLTPGEALSSGRDRRGAWIVKNVWNGRHSCDCGWTGMTRAQRRVQLVPILFVGVFGGMMALDGLGVVRFGGPEASFWQYPIGIAPLLVYAVLPGLLWRQNACPQCHLRLEPLQGHERAMRERARKPPAG
jgi:hypothetical protein